MPAFIVTALTVVVAFLARFAGLFSFVLSPVGSIVSGAVSVVVEIAKSPLGRAVIVTIVLVTLVVGGYFAGVVKGSRTEHAALTVQYEKDIADANARADAARAAADKKFVAGRYTKPQRSFIPGRVHNGSDGFARD